MKRIIVIAVVLIAFVSAIALFLFFDQDFRITNEKEKVEILDGKGLAQLADYENELVGQIQINGGVHALDKISVGFFEPFSYLSSGTNEGWSPDHKMKVNINDTGGDLREYHEITLPTNSSVTGRVILTAREADPESGLSFSSVWSANSKAIFIYGGGTPIGYKDMHTISLIYLVEQNKLYAIDRLEILTKKRDQLTNETRMKENPVRR